LNNDSTTSCIACFKVIKNLNRLNKGDALNKHGGSFQKVSMSRSGGTNIPNSLQEHWMPFTSNRDFKDNPRLITEAKGIYLKDHYGRTHIDASSGLFCNPLGHG